MSWPFAKPALRSRTGKRPPRRSFSIEHLEVRQMMAYNVLDLPTVAPPPAAETRSIAAVFAQAVTAAPSAAASVQASAATTTTAAPITTAAVTTKCDLDVTVQAGNVVPALAKDLNLLNFYGGEKVVVPTVIKNYGPNVASGKVTVEAYLSTSRTVDKNAIKLGETVVNVNLTNNSTAWIEVQGTVPSSLAAGTKYWIIGKITTSIKQSTINDERPSDRQFEFLGTPANKAAFEAQYFNFARSVFQQDFVVRDSAGTGYKQLNDPKAFLAAFEGDSLSPYMNAKGMPTLGVGINLDALTPSMTAKVASAVRYHYLMSYGKIISVFDNDVINMLKDQAHKGNAPAAIDASDDLYLFNASYAEREQSAINVLGKTAYSMLQPPARIAVMDMVYDTGTVPVGVANALIKDDYARAGFELINAMPTSRGRRTLAEFENILIPRRTVLGGMIGPVAV